MSKYQPLEEFLAGLAFSRVKMSFAEIESAIGTQLPPSAYTYRAWWSNNPTNSVATYAWLNAGYESSDVDMTRQTVVFRKSSPEVSDNHGDQWSGGVSRQPDEDHPLFGFLRGKIRIIGDLDLTLPADPEWGERVYGSEKS